MKVQVNVSDDFVAKIDKYAKAMGVSRSALCSMFIGQGIMGFDKSFQVIDSLGAKLGDSLLTDKPTSAQDE